MIINKIVQGNKTNMSVHGQTQAHAYKCGAFNTPPHFAHSRSTEAKCVFHAIRGKYALFNMHGLECGWCVRCDVMVLLRYWTACVVRMNWGTWSFRAEVGRVGSPHRLNRRLE